MGTMKTFAAFIAAMSLASAVAAHATTDAGPATNGAWPAAAPPASEQSAGLTDAWLSPGDSDQVRQPENTALYFFMWLAG